MRYNFSAIKSNSQHCWGGYRKWLYFFTNYCDAKGDLAKSYGKKNKNVHKPYQQSPLNIYFGIPK